MHDPAVVGVAEEVGRTPAQVLLRWGLQKGAVVIPKSRREERIRENAQIFDFGLDEAAMEALDALDRTGGAGHALEYPWWR